jgi:hypothetical protein
VGTRNVISSSIFQMEELRLGQNSSASDLWAQ